MENGNSSPVWGWEHWDKLVADFLQNIPNSATRCAYAGDLQKFRQFLTHTHTSWDSGRVALQEFADHLAQKGERVNTIKRRLAVLSAFMGYAHDRGANVGSFAVGEIRLPQPEPLKTNPCPDLDQMRQCINRDSLAGKRDYALVCLVMEGRWRREQLCRLNCADIDHLPISAHTYTALMDWLSHRGEADAHSPLFTGLGRQWGQRLTGAGLGQILQRLAHKAGSPVPFVFTALRQSHNLPSQSSPNLAPVAVVLNRSINPHQDLLAGLLADRRSPNTRRAYQKDLQHFFAYGYQQPPTPQLIEAFLTLDRFQAIAMVLQYKAHMIGQGLKEATVNRRLSALKSLVSFANKLGHCQWSLTAISGEPLQSYRDTTGIPPAGIRAMFNTIDRQTLRGKRNYAILRLLWDNALRRQEVSGLNVQDYDSGGRTLRIFGKGKGTQQTIISLSQPTQEAIDVWYGELQDLGCGQGEMPLFIALDPSHRGHRLTGTAIYEIVRQCARSAGITKPMSPHRIRHSAITTALDVTNGNVRKVQKLSRHRKLDTLMIYDDNRTNLQGEVSHLLSNFM